MEPLRCAVCNAKQSDLQKALDLKNRLIIMMDEKLEIESEFTDIFRREVAKLTRTVNELTVKLSILEMEKANETS